MIEALRIVKGIPALISRNRKAALFLGAVVLFFVSSALVLANAESRLARKKAAFSSFESMIAEYEKSLAEAGSLRDKLESAGAQSAFDAVQAVAAEAGVKKKISQLKPFEVNPVRGYKQSGAEAALEGLDIGQAVSFLYGLEKARAALLVDELKMKSSFEDPDKFELRARVRLVSRE